MASAAPTPAPHTPIVFLDAAGTNFWSIKCQEELIKAGFDPAWFGSYEHVSKLVNAAKNKCSRWRTMTPAERAADPSAQPTARDLFLSQCTVGHLPHVSAYTKAGFSNRHDPCAWLVSGFLADQAPCFPSEGTNRVVGSVEQQNGVLEQRHLEEQRRANAQPGSKARPNDYPQDPREDHEDLRGQNIVKVHQNENRLAAGVAAGQAEFGVPGAVNPADAVKDAKVKPPDVTQEQVVDGNNAAECINAWRRKAMEAMKTKAVGREIDRYEDAKANEATIREKEKEYEAKVSEIDARQRAARAEADSKLTRSDRYKKKEEEKKKLGKRVMSPEEDRVAQEMRDHKEANASLREEIRRLNNYDDHIQCLRDSHDEVNSEHPTTMGTCR